jgi:hypothetical protein
MKISKATLTILKNLAGINGNIWIDKGNLIMTKSTANNITAEASVIEDFPIGFGIYDLNEFLGVLSLFQDPELTFTDKFVTISEGKNTVKYFSADKSILTIPKARMSFELVDATADITFELTSEQLAQIIKTSAVLKVPNVSFVGNGKTLNAVISDIENKSSNSYSMEVGSTTSDCSVNYRVENLKMIPGSYTVDLSKQGVSRFSIGELVYHIAIEDGSTFE